MRHTWIVCLMLSTGSVFAAVAVSQTPYHLLPGKADADGCFPTTAARICLGTTGTEHCYAPPNSKDYVFGLDPKATPVGKIDGNELTLFTAIFSGCGSGILTDFSLLTVRNGEFVNLPPAVRLTNQSEYKLWTLSRLSSLPILVTANFIWDFEAMQKSNFAEETHFATHRYAIYAYVFDKQSGHYLLKAHYSTTKKYPGLDDVDEVKVLGAERPVILARLRHVHLN